MNIKKLFNKYFWLIALVWVIAIGAFVFWLASGPSEDEVLQQTVTNQQTEANKAVQQAANHNSAAVNASIERRSEDAVREKVITPKLNDLRRRSQNSKRELEKTQKDYQNAKTNLSNLNRSVTDNCSELKRLYPDTRFEYCQNR